VGTCDSFLGEGGEGVNEHVNNGFKGLQSINITAKPLPATSQPTAPLPQEGVLAAIQFFQAPMV